MTKDPSHFKIETTTTEKVAVKYQSMAKVFTALANFVHNTVS